MGYNNKDLIYTLTLEKERKIRSGIYGVTQRELAYNSNKIEGSTLSKRHTESLFENGTIFSMENEVYKSKDVEEMQGHFAMFNYMLDTLQEPLSEPIIKGFHKQLKQCVFEDIANGYNIGEYKGRKNFVSDITTALPNEVPERMNELLNWYRSQKQVTLETLADLHAKYENIHPFQDGNGRTGRLILFRECLKQNICPFIIKDESRAEYLTALHMAQVEDNSKLLVELFEKAQKEYSALCNGALMQVPSTSTLEYLIDKAESAANGVSKKHKSKENEDIER